MLRKALLTLILISSCWIAACSQIPGSVTPRLVNFNGDPVTVDLIPDKDGKLATIKWPVASIKAEVKTPSNANPIADPNNAGGITITSMKATFDYQNPSLIAASMPEYSAGLSVYIKPNETVGFPVSFFDDAHRNIAHTAFTNPLNNAAYAGGSNFDVFLGTTVTVTFYGHDDQGNNFELKTSFSALWGDWAAG